jgi:excisionase family DNA binding protein
VRILSESNKAFQTLTVEEVADALGIDRHYAYRAIRRMGIPYMKVGRLVKVPYDEFMEWKKSRIQVQS